MRILYGVVGEGMGHAMRSGVVLDHLTKNHEVQVVVSGRAHDYLVKRASERLSVRKIWGLNIVYEDNEVSNFRTVLANLKGAVSGMPQMTSRPGCSFQLADGPYRKKASCSSSRAVDGGSGARK